MDRDTGLTDYQRFCAARASKAMKGHNRHLAFKWTARAREIGEHRKEEADRRAHYAAVEVVMA